MISDFQQWVAGVFHELREAAGYALGGGAAAIAHDVVHRRTQDLDLFRRLGADVVPPPRVGAALRAQLSANGCTCEVLIDAPRLHRLVVRRGEDVVLVDIGEEDRGEPPVVTFMGPTVAMRDVGVGKLVALFDRAEARDFTDVFEFAQHFDREDLLALAQDRDGGLATGDLADRCQRVIDHYRADDLPDGYRHRHDEILEFYREWQEQLMAASSNEDGASDSVP